MTEPTLSPDTVALEARIAALEATVARLAVETAALRAELNGAPRRFTAHGVASSRAAGAGAPDERLLRELQAANPPAPTRSPSEPPRYDRRSTMARRLEGESVESLVGRYGMLVLATVTALAAVGTFLGWAIAHGLFGPVPRVVLGVVAAIGVMIGGHRLRRRERAFGSTLMALGLAMLHVSAWAAGPSLHLVPSLAAFTAVGIVSWGMAVFAQGQGDEPLWCAGFGGAAVAPFVTSNGGGHASLLAAYGAVVLVGGGYALASRPWRIAGRMLIVAAALFTGALIAMPEREFGPLLALALPLVVCVAGVLPFADRPLLRARLRGLGVIAAVAAARVAFSTGLPISHASMAASVAIAGLLWLVLCDRARHAPAAPTTEAEGIRARRGAWTEGFVLPLVFASLIPVALDAPWNAAAMVLGAASLFPFAAMMRREQSAERDALVGTSVACVLAAVMIATHDNAPAMAVAVAASALVFLGASMGWASWSWIVGAGVALVGSSVGALALLTDRAAYAYAPFATPESIAAGVVLMVWFAAGWLVPRACDGIVGSRSDGEHLIVTQTRRAPWVFGFLWIHQEIAWAVSPTVATLLRVSYYALTSVLCVGIGRWRDSAGLRHVGLALALVAGATALYGAHGLAAIAARVASYLVVSIFLLAIAYWYRRRDDEPAELGAAAGE